jgi:hypothetical protein
LLILYPLSSIRTITVGSGVSPDLLTLFADHIILKQALAGSRHVPYTAGGEFRPALRTLLTDAFGQYRPYKRIDN